MRALAVALALALLTGCAAKLGPVAVALGESSVTYCPDDEARLEDCPEVRGGQMSAGFADRIAALASMVPFARPAPAEPPTVIVQPEGVAQHEHRTGGPE